MLNGMEKMIIRPMNKTDINFVVSAVHGVHEASKQTGEIIDLNNRLRADILSEQPKAHVAIAEIAGQSVGMTLYSTVYFADEGEIMWQSQLFVMPEYRGKGVADRLIDYLKEVCKQQGYYAICGAIAKTNSASRACFKRNGGYFLEDFEMVIIKP